MKQPPFKPTPWYFSLVLRLLAVFWLLLLGAAATSFYIAYDLNQSPVYEKVSLDFEHVLTPLLEQHTQLSLFQPGVLAVGQYRIMALQHLDDPDSLMIIPDLHPQTSHVIQSLITAPIAQQTAAGNAMIAGPFTYQDTLFVFSRPLTPTEVETLNLEYEKRWSPRIILGVLGVTGLGALLLGTWFVRPLRRLRNATREIAHGVASPKLGRLPNRHDELGELARALSQTAMELAVSRDAQRRLLSDVSHELRSPLARSQVALDLLSSSYENIEHNRHYQQIEKDIYRLGAIIDSILWLSRLENGLDEPILEHTRLAVLLQDIKHDLTYAQQDWGQRLQLPASNDIEFDTDPILLRLVLDNLIRNAFQHGPEQGLVSIFASTDPHAVEDFNDLFIDNTNQTHNVLLLQVLDQGPGVDDSKIKQLFMPFFRADPSRNHGSGVGLGLAVCQRAIRVLGGDLNAQNHPDEGLLVTIRLPFIQPLETGQQNKKEG